MLDGSKICRCLAQQPGYTIDKQPKRDVESNPPAQRAEHAAGSGRACWIDLHRHLAKRNAMHATSAARGTLLIARPAVGLAQPGASCSAQQRPGKRRALHAAVLSRDLQQEDTAAAAAAPAPPPAPHASADSIAAKCAGSSKSGMFNSTGSSGRAPARGGPSPAEPRAAPPPQLAGQRSTQPDSSAARAAQQQQQHNLRLGVPPPEQLPRHLAVIMDGNSRWAQRRGLPPAAGYQRGVEALRRVVRCCHEWGIPCLTVSTPLARFPVGPNPQCLARPLLAAACDVLCQHGCGNICPQLCLVLAFQQCTCCELKQLHAPAELAALLEPVQCFSRAAARAAGQPDSHRLVSS